MPEMTEHEKFLAVNALYAEASRFDGMANDARAREGKGGRGRSVGEGAP
jgi:hypothetical protein